VPTAAKADFVERLLAAGSAWVEATSFVSARAIPQLGDGGALLAELRARAGARGEPWPPRGATLALGLSFFDEQLVAGFSNSAIFVLAILMAGVLEDYKESEAMPAALATSFDAVTDAVAFAGLVEPAVAARALHAETLAMLESVMAFMGGIGDDGDV
jgi:hypothetical protein